MDNWLMSHFHYTIPLYDYSATDENGLPCNNGSKISINLTELIDIKVTDGTMTMELIYMMNDDSVTRNINIMMLPSSSKIPDGFWFLKSIEYIGITHSIFIRIEKTLEEEKIEFREERIDKLLKKDNKEEYET